MRARIHQFVAWPTAGMIADLLSTLVPTPVMEVLRQARASQRGGEDRTWDPAAVNVPKAASFVLPEDGELAAVAERFRQRQPLPGVASPRPKASAVEALQLFGCCA